MIKTKKAQLTLSFPETDIKYKKVSRFRKYSGISLQTQLQTFRNRATFF